LATREESGGAAFGSRETGAIAVISLKRVVFRKQPLKTIPAMVACRVLVGFVTKLPDVCTGTVVGAN
jgi:hypothetical protein